MSLLLILLFTSNYYYIIRNFAKNSITQYVCICILQDETDVSRTSQYFLLQPIS